MNDFKGPDVPLRGTNKKYQSLVTSPPTRRGGRSRPANKTTCPEAGRRFDSVPELRSSARARLRELRGWLIGMAGYRATRVDPDGIERIDASRRAHRFVLQI